MRNLRLFFVLFLCIVIASPAAHADILGGVLRGTLGGFGDLLGDDAITTNVKDSQSEIPILDDFTPLAQQPLSDLKTDVGGKLLVTPGSHVGVIQSYCLHAGTYGPTKGAGYGLAPLKGPQASLIKRILQKSPERPDIKQFEIQTLIWTIEAGVDFKNMSPQMQQTLVGILAGKKKIPSPKDMLLLLNLKEIALQKVIPVEEINNTLQKLNELQRPLFLARNKVRQMNVIGGSFEELEQLSVLTGEPPKQKDYRDIPNTRWTYSKDSGVFMRFRPSGYSRTQIETYCPEKFFVRADNQGRIREIETESKSYKLEAFYDEEDINSPHISNIRLLKDGKTVFESEIDASLLPVLPLSTTPQNPKDVLRPGVSAHVQELQSMQRTLLGKKPRTLTPLVVNLTNYRDALAPAIAALNDKQARLVLSDFISRAWVATAYQWINEDKGGVRMARTFIDPSELVGRAGFRAVIWPGAVSLAVPVIEVTIGALVGPEVLVAAGGIAIGVALYEAVAVPASTWAQRLGQSGRLAPDQPRLNPPSIMFGPEGMALDYVISIFQNRKPKENGNAGDTTVAQPPADLGDEKDDEDLRPQTDPEKGREDTSHKGPTGYTEALAKARERAGDLGEDTERMYDPETGTLLGEQSADKKRGWRVDPDHVNWWNWTEGKKGNGGKYGHAWFPPDQSGPHAGPPSERENIPWQKRPKTN